MIYALILCCIVTCPNDKYTHYPTTNVLNSGRFPHLADSCTKFLFAIYFMYGVVRYYRLSEKGMTSYSVITGNGKKNKRSCIFLKTGIIWTFIINTLLTY